MSPSALTSRSLRREKRLDELADNLKEALALPLESEDLSGEGVNECPKNTNSSR